MISAVQIENYRGYCGISKAEFTKGLNVVSGENASGKTAFFLAIMWGLDINTNETIRDYNYAPIYNLLAYEKTEMHSIMSVKVSVDIIFKNDKINFSRTLRVQKEEVPNILDENFEVYRENEKVEKPELIVNEMFDIKYINEWFLNMDTLRNYYGCRGTISQKYDYKNVEIIANKIFQSIFFHKDIPHITITDTGKIISGGAFSIEESLFERLSIWFGTLYDRTGLKNKDSVILVDDIEKSISEMGAHKLSTLWEKQPQVIMCGNIDWINEFGWNIKNVIEIKKNSEYAAYF